MKKVFEFQIKAHQFVLMICHKHEHFPSNDVLLIITFDHIKF